jgi:hypothetical protein
MVETYVRSGRLLLAGVEEERVRSRLASGSGKVSSFGHYAFDELVETLRMLAMD